METRNNKIGKFIVFEGIGGSGKTTLINRLKKHLETQGVSSKINSEPTKSSVFGRVVRTAIELGDLKNNFISDEFSNSVEALYEEVMSRAKYIEFGFKQIENFFGILYRASDKLVNGISFVEEERQAIYVADRFFDLKDIILPTLLSGWWVLQDRFSLSTYTYGSVNGVPMWRIHEWHENILGPRLIVPDKVFLIDIEPGTAASRLKSSGKKIDIYETVEKLEKTYNNYFSVIRFINSDHNLSLVPKLDVIKINGNLPEEEVFREIEASLEKI